MTVGEWGLVLAAQATISILVAASLYHRLRQRLGRQTHELMLKADQQPVRPIYDESAINRVLFIINSPVKVGSSSIFTTLQQAFPRAIVEHLHGLSRELQVMTRRPATDTPEYVRGVIFSHSYRTMELRPELARRVKAHDGETGVYFVSATRDPIAWALSLIFHQNDAGVVPDEIMNVEGLQRQIVDMLEEEPLDKWFDREIHQYLETNVMEIEFDKTLGYQIYDTRKGPLLIIRKENLDRLPEALSLLTALPQTSFQPRRINVTEEKETGSLYREIRTALRFPSSFIERVYSTPYARTFYSAEERRAFAAKWSA